MSDWVAPVGQYLNEKDQLHNAQLIVNWFKDSKLNFSKESLSALLGNMSAESTLNPYLTEKDGYGGYGFVQWTPASKLLNWLNSQGLKDTPENQLKMLENEILNGISWYANNTAYTDLYPTATVYPESSLEFVSNKNKRSLNELTEMFTTSYERPNFNVAHMERRYTFAKKAFDTLDFTGMTSPNTGEGGNGDNNGNDSGDSTLTNFINKLFKVKLYSYGQSQTWSNEYIKITQDMQGIYTIQPNTSIKKLINSIIGGGDSGNNGDSGNDGETDNTEYLFIPVDNVPEIWYYSKYGYGGYGGGDTSFHAGIDLSPEMDKTPPNGKWFIYSVDNGTIKFSGWDNSAGNVLVMKNDSNRYYSVYMHMRELPFKKEGEKVKRGERIGIIGSTGNSTGPHLHFGLTKSWERWGGEDNTVDPRPFFPPDWKLKSRF